MTVELLDEAAAALGEMRDDVVFLGAATLVLWITDEGLPPLRPTADVDVVVEVTTLIEYNRFEARLRAAGFRDEGSVLGRFLFGPNDLQLDAIPADASILGFKNHCFNGRLFPRRFDDHFRRESVSDACRPSACSRPSSRRSPGGAEATISARRISRTSSRLSTVALSSSRRS